ncbi:hypothetical protein ONS96_014925 [Cadophora gregata f. sp. sojae]|nr:hypothetical protein ONS96_014925 [Cadophora gregata f. sp. sojae]
MFSATFPKMARELATQHLAHNHVRIHVGRAGSSHQNIKQDVIFVEPHLKKQALLDLLLSAPPARTIIFVNSKRAADEADDFLFNNNIPCTSIHAGRTQREREDSIRAFRSGKTPVLIATGVSARGLDIHKVMHVVNFDLPSAQYGGIQEYTHRIGRTGRIGNLGLATSFYDPRRDADIAEPLVKLMLETRQVIPDFLREFLPEGFTTDDDGNVTGDFAGLKFEDADEEDNAEGGCDGWGTDAQAAAPTETSDWATEKSQAAPIQATPAPVAPSLSSGTLVPLRVHLPLLLSLVSKLLRNQTGVSHQLLLQSQLLQSPNMVMVLPLVVVLNMLLRLLNMVALSMVATLLETMVRVPNTLDSLVLNMVVNLHKALLHLFNISNMATSQLNPLTTPILQTMALFHPFPFRTPLLLLIGVAGVLRFRTLLLAMDQLQQLLYLRLLLLLTLAGIMALLGNSSLSSFFVLLESFRSESPTWAGICILDVKGG